MQIVVVGRHTDVPDRFRRHVEDKLTKVTQLAPKAQRVDVELTHERNPRQADKAQRVELTVRDKGPVIRAEASADDRIAAFELAFTKLLERLRRAHDRRKSRNNQQPRNAAAAVAPLPDLQSVNGGPGGDAAEADAGTEAVDDGSTRVEPDGTVETTLGDSPVVIRQKVHEAHPMTLDDALYEMELVGHDFFLFVDSETSQPSVVYRRRGWSYGVIRLDAPVDVQVDSAVG